MSRNGLDQWFAVTLKKDGLFYDLHFCVKSKEVAERRGEKHGKVYGVKKVDRDELFREKSNIKLNPPEGLYLGQGIYENELDLDVMLGLRKQHKEKNNGATK